MSTKTLTREELKRLKAGGASVRVIERVQAALDKAVQAPEIKPAPVTRPEPVEVRLADPDTLERLVREERATRAALVEALAELEREPGPRRWRFTVTERDAQGFIKVIEAQAL